MGRDPEVGRGPDESGSRDQWQTIKNNVKSQNLSSQTKGVSQKVSLREKRSWKSLVPDKQVLQKVSLRKKEKIVKISRPGPGQWGPSKSVFEKKIIVKPLVPDKGFLQKVNWEKKIAKNLSFRTKGSFKKWFWEKRSLKSLVPDKRVLQKVSLRKR